MEVLLGKANPAAQQGFHCSLDLPLKPLELPVFHTVSLAAHTTKRISWLLGRQAVKLHCLANELMRGSERKAKKKGRKKPPCLSELGWSEGRKGLGCIWQCQLGRSFRIRKVKAIN